MRTVRRLRVAATLACLALLAVGGWCGPLQPQVTLAAFTDDAAMTATFTTEDQEPTGPLLVAFKGTDGTILAVKGRNAALYNGSAWQKIDGPPGAIAQLAHCTKNFVGTDGTNWYTYLEDERSQGWHQLAQAPMAHPTLLLGTEYCGATDGTNWISSEDGLTWSAANPTYGAAPLNATVGSQSGTMMLVWDGTEYWYTTMMGKDRWDSFPVQLTTGNPQPRPSLVVKDRLIRANKVWYQHYSTGTASYWPEFGFDNSQLSEPIAAFITKDDHLLMTDGTVWESGNLRDGQITARLDPPPL